jgi:hypothetical protein
MAPSRRRKQKVPKASHDASWIDWNGDRFTSVCFEDLRTRVTVFTFEAGHVVAESAGGSSAVTNLRPVCKGCNCSQGTRHMYEFIRENRLWVGKHNPFLKPMLERGEDPLELYPLDAHTPELLAKIARIKRDVAWLAEIRDVDDEAGSSLAGSRPTSPLREAPSEVSELQSVSAEPRRSWKDALVSAILRRTTASGDDHFTMKQLREHELERITRETRCTGATPQNTMARELQLLRDAGRILFLDNRGHYRSLVEA